MIGASEDSFDWLSINGAWTTSTGYWIGKNRGARIACQWAGKLKQTISDHRANTSNNAQAGSGSGRPESATLDVTEFNLFSLDPRTSTVKWDESTAGTAARTLRVADKCKTMFMSTTPCRKLINAYS
jgi:hypothetical protein